MANATTTKATPLYLTTKRGNWADDPCYYVDMVDGQRVALLAGPFQTLAEAEARKAEAVKLANDLYPETWFYAHGTCKMPNGYREGRFNQQLGL